MPQVALGAVALGASALSAGGVAAALAATGLVGAAAQFGASMLLSGVASALGQQRAVDAAAQSRSVSVREPVAPRRLIYGHVRTGGTVVYIDTSGDGKQPEKFLHLVIVLSARQVHRIGAIYFDGELALREDGSPTDRVIFKNKHGTYTMAWVQKQYGWERGYSPFGTLKADKPGAWTDAHRLEGCAAIHIKMDYQPDTYPGGIPNITADVWGRNDIYDPRTGTRGYTENAALCVANYMEDGTFGLRAGIGAEGGLSAPALIEAANACDEWVESHGVWEQRYRCNGVIDTSQTPEQIIESLLSAMAGKAIWKGGRWHLRAGIYRAPSLGLTDDDATGTMTLTTRRSLAENFNGVRGKFVSRENDWQLDDFPAYRSATYLEEDSGQESWRDITLPFTTSPYAAQRIAKIELETARRQLSVAMPARLRALKASCGDIVTLTHPAWGIADKPFEVVGVKLNSLANGLGVQPMLALAETSPLVYDWHASEAQIYAAAPRSTLPSRWFVNPPGITSVREELILGGSARVITRAVIEWAPSPTSFVDRYAIEASGDDGLTWQPVAITVGTSAQHDDWSPGVWRYRVQAITTLGARSAWSEYAVALSGLSREPAALQGVTLQTAGGLVYIKWDLPEDLDVRFGGRVVVRHSTAGVPVWSNSVSIYEVPGNNTVAHLPLMPGAYLLRPIDSSGIMGPVSAVYTQGAQAVGFISAGLLQADTAFSGTHDGTVSNAGQLQLATAVQFDDLPGLLDALPDWDYPTGVTTRGTYTFASTLAWASARNVRLRSLIETASLNTDLLWDSREGSVDDWQDWDGDPQGEADVLMEVRTTLDDPSASPIWSEWSRLDAGEYRARGVQARAILSTKDTNITPVVSRLRVQADEVA